MTAFKLTPCVRLVMTLMVSLNLSIDFVLIPLCLPLGMYTRRTGERLVYVSFQLLVNVLYILLKVTFKLLNTYPVKTRCSFILLYVMKSSIKVLDIKHLVS